MVRGWAEESRAGSRRTWASTWTRCSARTLAELDDVAELWQPVLERFVAVVRGEDPRPTALPLV